MIFNLFATRNKKSAMFGKIDMELFDEKQAIESYSVAVLEAGKEQRVLLDELDLYLLGSYDTETGIVTPVNPKLLLDLGAVTYEGRK